MSAVLQQLIGCGFFASSNSDVDFPHQGKKQVLLGSKDRKKPNQSLHSAIPDWPNLRSPKRRFCQIKNSTSLEGVSAAIIK